MPTIDKYSSDAYIRLLLQGPSGAGKTTAACQFPRPWIFDCDQNLAGPLRWLKAKGKTLPVGYDIIDRSDEGVPVAENLRWSRLMECVNRVGKNNADLKVETLVFDSMSKISNYNKAHVLRTNPTKTGNFEQASWGFFHSNWLSLVGLVTAAKVHSIFIAHDKVDKDEADGTMKIMLNMQGAFQAEAGSMFTDVWHAEVKAPMAPATEHIRLMRTAQDYKYSGLKDSFGLPAVFEFSWETIQAKLNGETK